ncbi:MAG: hypothetical protein ACP5HZ_08975 [Ferrimicrobium sp.]|nr:hypothetical protein [Ferrimicrobium sp.]
MTKKQLELFEQQQQPLHSSEYRRELGLHGVAKVRHTLSSVSFAHRDVA